MIIKYPGNHYKNIATKRDVNPKDIFGKQFIMHQALEVINWKKTDEVKTIGKYLCFKATAEIPNEKSFEDKNTTGTVTAWYTIDIPVSHGTGMYWGLQV